MEKKNLEHLLDTEDEQLQKLNAIVVKAIEEEKLLSQKRFEFEDANPTLSNKLADGVASFGGSWKFILYFVFFMLAWIALNVYWQAKAFDPYPFILLNLLLSTIAALQAPIIMMSQKKGKKKKTVSGRLMIT